MSIRAFIINSFIDRSGYTRYLEIGVGKNFNTYNGVKCRHKTGIDLFEDNEWYKFNLDKLPPGVIKMSSDELFAKIRKTTYDIAFVDGLHHYEQVLRDIRNALKVLSPKGVVLVDDVDPETEIMQRVPRESKIWTGDVWKAWLELRCDPNLMMHVIDITKHGGPYGIGVIQKGEQEPLGIDITEVTFADLQRNRIKWLNILQPRRK